MKSSNILYLCFVLLLFLFLNQVHAQTSFIDIPHPLEAGSPRYGSFMVAGADGHMFIISKEGYFFRSTDDGESWEPFETPFEGLGVFGASGSYDGILVVSAGLSLPDTYGNTWISEDNGLSWRALGDLQSGWEELYDTEIWIKQESITIKRTDDLFYGGTDFFTIYDLEGGWTTDPGGRKVLPDGSEMRISHSQGIDCYTVCSWIVLYDPSSGDETSISIYEESGEDILGFWIHDFEVLSDEHWLFATSYGLHITEDAGETWTLLDEGALQGSRRIIKTEFDELIILTRQPAGLVSSRDDGQSWQVVLSEFNQSVFASNFVNSSNGYLYVYHTSTNSDTILRSEFNFTSITEDVSEIPARAELHQNYPNPFNPSTTITFDLSEPVQTTLEVYDMQGRRVEQLISNRILPQGTHRISWEPDNQASGMYVYRLKAGDEVQTRNMLLIK